MSAAPRIEGESSGPSYDVTRELGPSDVEAILSRVETLGHIEQASGHGNATAWQVTMSRAWLCERGLLCLTRDRPVNRASTISPLPSQGNPRPGLRLRDGRDSVPAVRAKAIVRCVADIEPEEVRWLWPGRVPRGRVTFILGRQGKGKSTLTSWLAATVSKGAPWPDTDEPNSPGTVLILQAEESASEDIRPRLDGMGADQRKIHVLMGVNRGESQTELPWNLARDCDALGDLVRQFGDVKLLIVDPLGSYVQGISGHNDAEVRSFMSPLFRLAEEAGLAVILVMHPNKDPEKDILDRVSNSGAFTQMARIGWYYSDDPKHPNRRLLSLIKGNLRGQTKTALAASYSRGRLAWNPGAVKMDAFAVDNALQRIAREQKLHGRPGPAPSTTSAVKEWVVKYLTEKGDAWASVVWDQAEVAGWKESSYRKALRRLMEDDGRLERFQGGDGKLWLRLLPEPTPVDPPTTREPTADGGDPSSATTAG